MKKKYGIIAGAFLAGYLLLLRLLVLAESASPDASIQTMGQAAWYSLVTLTTVGYGDSYPVTVWGRIIGLVFLLCSTGLLALLLGAVLSFFSGSLLPRLALAGLKKRNWYVFSRQCPEALTMASHLRREDPRGVVLYLDGKPRKRSANTYGFSGEFREIPRIKGKNQNCSFFFLGTPDGYPDALACSEMGYPVYCQTDLEPAECPENLTLFSAEDCCARRYWQDHPLGKRETSVVILGCDAWGEKLLERGLLTNVLAKDRVITYHVFGDSRNFQRTHHRLLAGDPPVSDRVIFHEEPWTAAPGCIQEADRLILSDEGPLAELLRYYPTLAAVHVRRDSPAPGTFGSREEIFTPELVMHRRLSRMARMMHELYRAGTGGTAPAWEALSPFTRESNIASADHLLTKVRTLLPEETVSELTADVCRRALEVYQGTRDTRAGEYRRMEHERWLRFHVLRNWTYSPTRDNALRRHPDLRPFEDLSPAEQAKDDYAWELLSQVAGELDRQQGGETA